MIEALGMIGAVALASIPAAYIGKAIYRRLRRDEREARREQARLEQKQIAELYYEMLERGVIS